MTEVTGAAGATDSQAPLGGVRVVEISMYIQGPVAGLALARLGADVVKIEQVGRADIMRTFSSAFGVELDERGQAWLYSALNRGKRSVALDPASEQGRDVFRRLIERADVFVTNLRADALARLAATPADLHAMNPRLVYARGGGFGFDGPLAADPCQDTVGMAYGGFMDLASANGEPNYPPGALSDVLTGTNLASAVLAALVKRGRDGTGTVVGTSQLQSLLWLELMPVGLASSLGLAMARFNRRDTANPLFSVYPTADGWIAIAAIHPEQWPPIAGVLDLDHVADDPRFASFAARSEHRRELIELLDARFRTRPTQDWWQALRAAGVWTAPVNEVGELANDEQVRANDYLVSFPDGFTAPPVPFDVGEWRGRPEGVADYGEHTDAVLAELGLPDADVVDLRVNGAIW